MDWPKLQGRLAVVNIEVVYIGCRVPGDTWCADCALPSVLEVDWAYANAATLRLIGRSTNRWCVDCGAVTPIPVTG